MKGQFIEEAKHVTQSKLTNSYLNPQNINTPSVVVYGPQGCGKTRNALAIAAALGLRNIRDSFDGTIDQVPDTNTLVLTNQQRLHQNHPRGLKVMSYQEAMNIVRPMRGAR